jgi:hypothetical protein
VYRVFPSCYAPTARGAGLVRLPSVAAREDMGSWLEGGPSDGASRRRLGLPAHVSGSLASLGRRLAALAVDWVLCLAIAGAFFAGDPMATLGVFALENVLLVGTVGFTVGHRLLGLQVRSLAGAVAAATPVGGPSGAPRSGDGGTGVAASAQPGLARAAVRTVLLCLVIPAVVWDAEGRSLHDRAAGTVIVRR